MIDRLEEDHRNASLLAEGLVEMDGIYVNLETVQTNIVLVDISGLDVTADQFVLLLKEEGLLALARDEATIRFVTHRGIRKEHIQEALAMTETAVKRSQINS
jgi:threonine aldolase